MTKISATSDTFASGGDDTIETGTGNDLAIGGAQVARDVAVQRARDDVAVARNLLRASGYECRAKEILAGKNL